MLTSVILASALSLGQCANGQCNLQSGPAFQGRPAVRLVTAPGRFLANRQPVRRAGRLAGRAGRGAARLVTAPFRLLCR